ncbi:related to Cuticle-degrading protease [Lecanosticta acicola]|uniref:Related to Cuticle-degrading protease n=1 Tax=Lecanosticta acicola TaxID=111012 RepID=A0AAI8Z1U8_9PEZI|nr:related to Cuticle-degrading protease [Lecanosticta acicola]
MKFLLAILLAILLALPEIFAVPKIIRRQTAHTLAEKWIAQINEDSPLASILTTVQAHAGIQACQQYKIECFKDLSFDGDDAMLDLLETVGAIKSI